MKDRRRGARHSVSFPVRLKWKDENGKFVVEEGLTENVGPRGTLVYLPRFLPIVGSKVKLTVTERRKELSVTAEVLRVERNAAHPQAALELVSGIKIWKEKVWEYAAKVLAKEQPEIYED